MEAGEAPPRESKPSANGTPKAGEDACLSAMILSLQSSDSAIFTLPLQQVFAMRNSSNSLHFGTLSGQLECNTALKSPILHALLHSGLLHERMSTAQWPGIFSSCEWLRQCCAGKPTENGHAASGPSQIKPAKGGKADVNVSSPCLCPSPCYWHC